MTERNQHIEEYLNAYRKMEEFDFAVMITGPWGCGKTRFIDKYLKAKCTTQEHKEYIYISLNGISSVSDIDMALFQATHPLLGSKLAVTTGKILKASLRAGLKLDLDFNDDGKTDGTASLDPGAGLSLTKFGLSSKGKLLVFDDLERCLLPPEEVLGYINAFVEKGEARVILIGDESHIGNSLELDDPASGDSPDTDVQPPSKKYWIIKEKVIGKTLRLDEQIEDIFADLISTKALPNTSAVILRNKGRIIASFKAVRGRYNYRALKHTFRDFEYFYKKIDSGFLGNEQFSDDLCRAFIAIGYEVQLATISTDKEWSATSSMVRYMGKQHSPEIELTDFDKLLDRHELKWDETWSHRSAIFSPEIWQKIFKNERVERDVLSAQIKAIPYFSSEVQEEWVQLYNWDVLEDDKSKALVDTVLAGIQERRYVTSDSIMHIFSSLMHLVKEKAIESSIYADYAAVEAETKKYLDALVADNRLKFSRKYRGMYWDKDHCENHLEYRGRDTFSKPLVILIGDAIDQTLENEKVCSIEAWLNDVSGFIDSVAFANGEYRSEPVFKYITPDQFFEALLDMSNMDKWSAISRLRGRYEGTVDIFADELPFWTELCRLVKEKNASHSGLITPSAKCLKSAESVFLKIVESLTPAPENSLAMDDEGDGD
jgi:hypothetical protein